MAPPFSPQDIVSLAIDAERGVVPDGLTNRLKRLVEEYAFQAAYCDPDQRLTAADSFPGYLVTNSGRWTVYVPWALAFAFPSPDVLDGLVAVAERSMLEGRGNVVLSGSTTFSGRFAGLGDIDLAQYVFDDAQHFSDRVRELVQRPGSAILVRVKYLKEYVAPWDGLIATLGGVSALTDEEERIKFEFIDGETPFGLMPVSNIVLPADPGDRSKAAAKRSFVFQEAVLALAENPPWPLVMADELSRYLKFLVRDTRAYRHAQKPIKALKRTLSLVRILGMNDLGTRAETVLASELANMTSHESCLKELGALWPHLSLDRQSHLEPALREKKGIVPSVEVNNTLIEESTAIVDEALERMAELLSHEDETIEVWANRKP